MTNNHELQHIIEKSLDAAADGYGALSTGEGLAAALVLNRPDWLSEMGYTLGECIERVGRQWMELIPEASRQVARSRAAAGEAISRAWITADLQQLKAAAGATDDVPVFFNAALVSYGNAPGYRDVSFVLELQEMRTNQVLRAEIQVRAEDGVTMMEHIRDVHRFVWRSGSKGPLDMKPNETRPHWL